MKKSNIPQAIDIETSQQWETALLTSDPETQVYDVEIAEDAARALRKKDC